MPSGEKKRPSFLRTTNTRSRPKSIFFQKKYNEALSGFTLDQMKYKQVENMFNVLNEFIHQKKEFIPPKRLNYNFFISKILELLFKKPVPTQKINQKKLNDLGQFSSIFFRDVA